MKTKEFVREYQLAKDRLEQIEKLQSELVTANARICTFHSRSLIHRLTNPNNV